MGLNTYEITSYEMIIAKQKKKENIAEYVLYMWQVEDLIRASQFDMQNVEKMLISQYQQPKEVMAEIRDWYENLIEMMTLEGKKEKGHLQMNINTLMDLTELHGQALSHPEQLDYQQTFTRVYSVIQEFREKSKAQGVGDIELVFNALYSYWLLKLQQREISEETQQAMSSFSELVAKLSRLYHQRERGEIEI